MILGTSAYKAGYSAAAFRPKIDAGLGWLRGATATRRSSGPTTWTCPTPSGSRSGPGRCARRPGRCPGTRSARTTGEPPRSFAADVAGRVRRDDKLWSATIAARLAESLPGVYADITPEAVGSQLRALGVDVKNVREPGAAAGTGLRAGGRRGGDRVRTVTNPLQRADLRKPLRPFYTITR